MGIWNKLLEQHQRKTEEKKEQRLSIEKKKVEAQKRAQALKPDNCMLCDKDISGGFFGARNGYVSAFCTSCTEAQPKQWAKAYLKANTFDDKEKLLDIVIKGSDEHLFSIHGTFDYKGGHPDLPNFKKVALSATPEGITVFDTEIEIFKAKEENVFFTIEWNRIKNISADSETITKGSGLAALGALSGRSDYLIAGSALRSTETNNFLNITYKAPALETVISFEGKFAEEAAAYYIAKMSKYVTDEIADDVEPSVEKESLQDPIEQIKKLSELKDAGILSEEEFEEKKKELLSKI